MKTPKLWHAGIIAAAAIFIFSACAAPTWYACRDESMKPQQEWKYSEIKAAIACNEVMLRAAGRYDKEKDLWELDPNVVTVADMIKVLQDREKSIDELLSNKDRELVDMINWFPGLRPAIEKEELITFWLTSRLLLAKTFDEFSQQVGELPKDMVDKETEYFFPTGRKTYSLRMIYPKRNIANIPFTAAYLETARAQGTLALVDTFYVRDTQTYDKKNPSLRNMNEFSWEKRARGWKIDSYKIMTAGEKPDDNSTQYIEVFRVYDKDGKEFLESKPAVRGFLSSGGQNVSVVLVDYDKEDEAGFGSPDTVQRIFSNIVTGRDLYLDSTYRQSVLEALYDNPKTDRQKPERRKQPDKPIYLEIAPMSKKVDVELWEQGKWAVPFEYKNLSQNMELVLKKPEEAPEEKLAMQAAEHEKLKKIKLIRREFKRDGTVVVMEYWIPKDEFAERNLAEASAYSTTMMVRKKGGAKQEGDVEYFGKGIKMIDYLIGGRWFRLLDEDGDGVFEKKRSLPDPIGGSSPTSVPQWEDPH